MKSNTKYKKHLFTDICRILLLTRVEMDPRYLENNDKIRLHRL